ncbi:nucleoside diphosphate kinase regulator [Collimonas sp. OK412]|jgi:regulator of nucleoside diphosphate kinase|uniref:nucleoside diphosphate kinase regulator n=1 Tax=Collimonas sp. (strain OK412) TaxID=1801619 RepID=UPI0008E1EB11|nr:nucleoside diphosphate kinase regulator [Collimonas sp. OK412]SFC26726.1 GreA/GreB family elongation factor [Collimonas sp. OK412]
MDIQPPLIISSFDLERIEQLLASSAYRNLPGVDALQNELGRATVVAPEDMPPGVITMNSAVRFIDEVSNTEYGMTLAYPSPSNPPDAVSILAPVGSALLGLSVGQSISWQGPGGRPLQLRILDVTYQPEANGEFHL